MKVRLTQDAVRFRLTRAEIAALAAGERLSVSAGGFSLTLLAATHASIVSRDDAMVISIQVASIDADASDLVVYSGMIEATAVNVELDRDTI